MDNAGDEKETQLCLTFKQPESLPKFSLYWIWFDSDNISDEFLYYFM